MRSFRLGPVLGASSDSLFTEEPKEWLVHADRVTKQNRSVLQNPSMTIMSNTVSADKDRRSEKGETA